MICMDLDIKKIKEYTESINTSVKRFSVEESNVKATLQNIDGFINYLRGQYTYISKFKSVESDIIKFLETFDYKRKYTFEVEKHCCDTLPGIEGKIVQISKMSKFVQKRPDRYGLSSSIRSCVDFTQYCAEKMTIGEVDRAFSKSTELIRCLQKVIDAFRKEDELLKEINLIMKENAILLQNYPAYQKELKNYIASYPHENNGDIQYVKKHLQDLLAIDKKFVELNKELESVSGFVNRYNKQLIVSKVNTILKKGTKNLVYSDLYRVSEFINKALQKIIDMRKNFRNEERTVLMQYKELQNNTKNIWKEDIDKMCEFLKRIQSRGTCFVDFSMDDFMNKKKAAIQKKSSDIINIYTKYHWLKRRKYQSEIINLSNLNIYSMFVRGIDDIKSRRGIFTRLYEFIVYK